MRDPILDGLMIHRCTIVAATIQTASVSSYGHKTPSFSTPLVTYPNVICRLRPLSLQEIQSLGRAGQILNDYFLYIPWGLMPLTLRQLDASLTHQVQHITTADGTLVDAGPFDIQSIPNQAGMDHHVRMVIRRSA